MATHSTQNEAKNNDGNADPKAIANAVLKGVRKADATREVKREEATLYTWKAKRKVNGKEKDVRIAELIRRRAIVRLNLLVPPADAVLAAAIGEEYRSRLDKGNRQGGVEKHFQFGMQVGDAATVALANTLLKNATK